MKRDNYILGVILGIIVPLFGLLLLYTIKWMPKDVELSKFIYYLKSDKQFASSSLSLALIACIFLFTYFKNRKLYKTLYGTFIAVGMYAVLIIGWKISLF